ncbi:MAG TPA: SRPBCC family protein [Candidatus Binatia bacterium]|nr:SRPBCC family protein [Candidatus Binatia bacterium]
MSRIIESIDVDVPVRVAYDQWTQFESFPQFMEGVERVVQLDDKTLEWTASIAGKTKHWRAEILEQRPDEVVAWRSIEGARNDGAVEFETLGPGRTRIELQLDVEPKGLVEKAGDALGRVEGQVKGDLQRFKQFVERRGQATGAWRGTVEGSRVQRDDADAVGARSAGMGSGPGSRADGTEAGSMGSGAASSGSMGLGAADSGSTSPGADPRATSSGSDRP